MRTMLRHQAIPSTMPKDRPAICLGRGVAFDQKIWGKLGKSAKPSSASPKTQVNAFPVWGNWRKSLQHASADLRTLVDAFLWLGEWAKSFDLLYPNHKNQLNLPQNFVELLQICKSANVPHRPPLSWPPYFHAPTRLCLLFSRYPGWPAYKNLIRIASCVQL